MKKLENTLVIFPTSGLCNRIEALESAFELAEQMNYRLIILWDHVTVPCSFEKLFEVKSSISYQVIDIGGNATPENNDSGTHRVSWQSIKHFLLLRMYKRTVQIVMPYSYSKKVTYSAEKLREYKSAFIEACSYLTEIKEIRHIAFCRRYYAKCDEMLSLYPKSKIIGVHIRRGDHLEATKNSPTELFLGKIKEQIAREPDCHFYIATDDCNTVDRIKECAGDHITVQIGKSYERFSLKGQEEAVIDLLALSRTGKIWGSSGSTFSSMAATIGNIPLEILKNDSME